jgi:hypothetical protein
MIHPFPSPPLLNRHIISNLPPKPTPFIQLIPNILKPILQDHKLLSNSPALRYTRRTRIREFMCIWIPRLEGRKGASEAEIGKGLRRLDARYAVPLLAYYSVTLLL